MERYSNKRIVKRAAGGQFRKATLADHGIDGVCPTCRHFLFRHYDGDQNDAFPDPRKFRSRCLTCEPYTEAEQAAIDAQEAKNKQPSMMDLFRNISETTK